MKKLTRGQRFALAREARRLAMECVENGPEMKHSWCGCAIGICLTRAGLWVGGEYDEEMMYLAADIDALVSGKPRAISQGGLVSDATMERISGDNPAAVVFPLLALADALEASAASARKRPQKQSTEVP